MPAPEMRHLGAYADPSGHRQTVGEARLLARDLGVTQHVTVREVGPHPDDSEQSGRLEPRGVPKDRAPI
jgi:hypothetical protein